MTHSPDPSTRDDLPPALSSLWRTLKLGYRAEPRLLGASFAMTLSTALPDALLALWLMVLTNGVTAHHRTTIIVAAIGLALSSTATWYLRVLFDRVQRRFRSRSQLAGHTHPSSKTTEGGHR